MVYFALLSYIVLYLYVVRVKEASKLSHFFLLGLPVMALLVIVLGLQENVGTDYQSYYQIAEGIKNIGWIEARNETLFAYLVRFTQRFSDPQLLCVPVKLNS